MYSVVGSQTKSVMRARVKQEEAAPDWNRLLLSREQRSYVWNHTKPAVTLDSYFTTTRPPMNPPWTMQMYLKPFALDVLVMRTVQGCASTSVSSGKIGPLTPEFS